MGDRENDKLGNTIDPISWLHQEHPEFNLIVEPGVAEHFKEQLPFVHVVPPGKEIVVLDVYEMMFILLIDHKNEYTRVVDFAITLGGDGTLLHLASLFPKAAPPVVSFSLGTLGFLMSFRKYGTYKLVFLLHNVTCLMMYMHEIGLKHFRRVLNDMTAGKMSLMLRMRLFCSLHQPDGRRISVDGKEVGKYPIITQSIQQVNMG